MVSTAYIEKMMSNQAPLEFVFPSSIYGINKQDIVEFNRNRYFEEVRGNYEFENKYSELDFLLSEYYLSCSIEKKISEEDFFILLKIMITEYESTSFVSLFSNETYYFYINSCNEYFQKIYELKNNCKSYVSINNLRRYMFEVFNNRKLWKDGEFMQSLLSISNQERLTRF